jgi:hypothetical protein
MRPITAHMGTGGTLRQPRPYGGGKSIIREESISEVRPLPTHSPHLARCLC